MNNLRNISLFCLMLLSGPLTAAESFEWDQPIECNACGQFWLTPKCHLGTAAFSTSSSNLWYTIDIPAYPNTVPLSLNQNSGFTEGKIELTSTGLLIEEPGNYWASFNAIIVNPQDSGPALIPVFLVPNGVFDPNHTPVLGSVVSVPFQQLSTVQFSGILENVVSGTTFSLVATNGGGPELQPITVVGWSISLFKIPCRTPCKKKHTSSSHS